MDLKTKRQSNKLDISHLIELPKQLGHNHQILHRFNMRCSELDNKSVLHLRVRRRLQQILQRKSNMLVAASTLNQIDDIGNATVAQPELLLMEPTVFDAARQIVHSLALDNVRQHVLRLGCSFQATYPQEVADAEATHLKLNTMAFQFLNGCVEASL